MGASSIESEYNDINSRNGWNAAFQSIKETSEQEAKEKKFTLDECNKSINRILNRYRDVSPYDHSRIVLQRGDCDYINANLVKMEKVNRKYILTQGPLKQTVGHFWQMVWEQNSTAILMLNKLIEKNTVKCHKYWPEHIGSSSRLTLKDVGLIVEYLKCEEYTNFMIRTFRLTDEKSQKSREVLQFHYTTWPDFCIPSSPIAFLQFLKKVRDSGVLNADVGPAIVHCSAGIGRSGTFCLVDTALVLIENEGENKVNVSNLLLELRQYRMGLIQTSDQLFFSYQAIIEGMKLLNDPSFTEYEEVPRVPTSYQDQEEVSDAPPPLPPPRGASLNVNDTIQKPLPTIPMSASAQEFLEMEARNNSENIERSRNALEQERPLPPLPHNDGSLDEEDEVSENGSYSYDDDDDDDDDDDEDDIDEVSSADENAGDEDKHLHSKRAKLTNGSREDDDCSDAGPILPTSPSKTSNTSGFNSISSLGSPPSPDSDRSTNAELRRRKRAERQTAIEEKIRDIKRKQKESEADADSAVKKRRFDQPNSGEKKSD